MDFKTSITFLLLAVSSLQANYYGGYSGRPEEDYERITFPKSDDSDSSESDESFEGPLENPKCIQSEEWPLLYPTCTGLNQSPINIQGSTVQTSYRPVPPLCWKNYQTIPESMVLVNEGHTLQMSGKWRNNEIPSISCGVLKGTYQFAQWHCHWGKTNNNGSDHTFNGRQYPMECHYVHFRKDCGTFENATKLTDGIAVISYLFDISNGNTLPAAPLEDALTRLVTRDNVTLPNLPLSDFSPAFTDRYVTYKGSLTTPPCSESVIWIICTKPRMISTSLMKKFRRVSQGSECMNNNFRKTQEINGRDIIFVATS